MSISSRGDSSPESVRNALSDLQLKTQLLEEERDYYTNLFAQSHRAFEDHRAELASLIDKERQIAKQREDRLNKELQTILQENATMRTQAASDKAIANSRVSSALEQFQKESLQHEQSQRIEIEDAHRLLLDDRRSVAALRQQYDEERRIVGQLKERQIELQERVAMLTRGTDQQLLHRASDIVETSPIRGRSVSPSKLPPFIPSGKTKPQITTSLSTTHNVHGLLQTARHRAYRSPPRCIDRNNSHNESHQLNDVAHSILTELRELRGEYDGICRCLGDPANASSAVGRKLREIFAQIDVKTQQLEAVRKSQARMDTIYRIDQMLCDAEHRTASCVRRHDQLMAAIHAPSV